MPILAWEGDEGGTVWNGGVEGQVDLGPDHYKDNKFQAGVTVSSFSSSSLNVIDTSLQSTKSFTSSLHLHTSLTMADDAVKAKLRAKFEKLTPADFQAAAGNKDALVEKVSSAYGISKEEATKQVDEAFAS